MQTADKHQVATPADWQPGDDVIVPPRAPVVLLKSEQSLPDRYPYVVKDVLDFCQPQKGFWVDLGAGKPFVIDGEATPLEAVQPFVAENLKPAPGFCKLHHQPLAIRRPRDDSQALDRTGNFGLCYRCPRHQCPRFCFT